MNREDAPACALREVREETGLTMHAPVYRGIVDFFFDPWPADLDCFIFDVYGYGHGCGMSQWGAIGYARNGWGYQDILTHYFVGTTITTY